MSNYFNLDKQKAFKNLLIIITVERGMSEDLKLAAPCGLKGSGRSVRSRYIFTLILLLLLVRFNVLFRTSKGTDILITDFYSCDVSGNPQDYFPKKTTAYFNISVRNLAQDPKNISINLSAHDELNVPIGSDQLYITIPPDVSTYCIRSIFIPKWAYVGVATAYVFVAVEGSPVDSKSTEFYIGPVDLIPPVIHLLSPENVTYETEPVPLVFTVDERTAWMAYYSLNNQENVTIPGNTTLTGLANGSYRIIVYANDTSGNVGFSEVYFTILFIHDVAIIDLERSSAWVYTERVVNITVFVQNKGTATETFNVTTYVNTTAIETLTVTNLPPSNQATLVFTWNTAGFAKGKYAIKAIADPVPDETNTTDNTLTDGWVSVTIPGDINCDGTIGLIDLVTMVIAYGSKLSDSNWNPNADIDDNGNIGLTDLIILIKHYGQTDP